MARAAVHTFVLLMLVVAGASAQTSVRGEATVTIGEVLQLEAVEAGGAAVVGGGYVERQEAVSVRVRANRRWRLLLRMEGGARLAGGGAGEPERLLYWRAHAASPGVEVSPGSGYQAAGPEPAVIATGAPGRSSNVVVDYRWLDGPGRDRDPAVLVSFVLVPED